ncbi:MAG: hypothetical protein ACE5KZ_05520 [Candidatus Scalinduaceae bacterium]
MRDREFCEHEDWDEDDWERFLQKADVRTAKYLELFETLHNHPDCDELVAKEMGWYHKGNDCEKNDECQAYINNLQYDEIIEEDIEDVKKIPAYKKSYEFYIKLNKYFKNKNKKDVDIDEDVMDAISASAFVSAKVAGGHGMGYEKDSLCGNIAICKRALKNAKICIYSLEKLRAKALFPENEINILISDGVRIKHEVTKWIDELRSRIWWR